MTKFLYTYACQLGEHELSRLEQRAFFGEDTAENVLMSDVCIEPSRSPFIRARIDLLFVEPTVEGLCEQVKTLDLGAQTFKITHFNDKDLAIKPKMARPERLQMMRTVADCIEAEPDLTNPDVEFALLFMQENYYFGKVVHGESVWLHHMQKPEMYSTALSTRVARAVANIAAPQIDGVKVIDPCCGIGTVLVEAMSMGVDIKGRDMNKRVVWGSRINLRHFGYEPDVDIGPIEEAPEGYDVAIVDMPYNLFTHISSDLQSAIIKHARRIARRVVIVTIESMDDKIAAAGLTVVDRGVVQKSNFEREIVVCE
ncbi:MAG: RNA methyltransferase [Solibacillus sp.]